MKKLTTLVSLLAITLGVSVTTPAMASTNGHINPHLHTIKDTYLNDLIAIRQYEKAAYKFGDIKTYNAGRKAWHYTVKDYAKHSYSLKFDTHAQKYLITYRLYYQRDSNPYYLTHNN